MSFSLSSHFSDRAKRLILGVGTLATVMTGTVGNARASEGPEVDFHGEYTFLNEDGVPLGTVEFIECGKKMCLDIAEAGPAAAEALNIPEGTENVRVVKGLQSDGEGGFEDGSLELPPDKDGGRPWGHGADVTVSPKDDGNLEIVAAVGFFSEEGTLVKKDTGAKPIQVASAKPRTP